ncbi:MAG: hypothetical protein ABSD67_14930 [Terracidiphilus sp.]|jgi:hypothetical protein
MFSFRRLALLLALAFPAMHVLVAQSSSSSSNPAPPTPSQDSQSQTQSQGQTPGQLSVQARIRARRAQRRAAAIHEVYDHLYEIYGGAGYLRFTPGSTLQRVNEYDWNVGFTRYYSERLGLTIDGRGYYGTPFITPLQSPSGETKPAISQYAVLAGPTYRFYLQPKYSISLRGLAGFTQGNFSGDINGFNPTSFGLWPDGSTFAASASVIAEYNLAPTIGLRVVPEYYATGFGSSVQNNLGFTAGIVYRFGKQ